MKSGLSILLPGLVLTGDGSVGRNIRAFAGTTNVINIVGYVNRIEQWRMIKDKAQQSRRKKLPSDHPSIKMASVPKVIFCAFAFHY